jgi:hypothetical protein
MTEVQIPRSTSVRSWAPEIYVDGWIRDEDLRFTTRPDAATAAMSWMVRTRVATDYQGHASWDPPNSIWSYKAHAPVSCRRSWAVEGEPERYFTHADARDSVPEVDEDEDPPRVYGTDDEPTHYFDSEVGIVELSPANIAARLTREGR